MGAHRLDAVALGRDGRVLAVTRFEAADLASLVRWVDGATGVGVDSPDGWSTEPHAGDPSLPPKFRSARCGEIALARQLGIWVPWTTPAQPAAGSWMETGISLFAALRAAGHSPLEVYPHAVFRVLAGRRPPAKTTAGGRGARVHLLAEAGVHGTGPPEGQALPSHHALDAAAAALVARAAARGRARAASCGHDGSAIWLPPAPPDEPGRVPSPGRGVQHERWRARRSKRDDTERPAPTT